MVKIGKMWDHGKQTGYQKEGVIKDIASFLKEITAWLVENTN